MITEYRTEFAGLPVAAFDETVGSDGGPPPVAEVAWRVGCHTLENGVQMRDFEENLDLFVETVDTSQVTHLVLGWWGYDEDAVADLLHVADAFPNLRAMFFGDILDWEHHISWIEQFDLTPLFEAYPGLEHFETRGGKDLHFEPLRSDVLRVLRFESSGLPAGAVQGVAAGDLPALEHLDLWLGGEEYGRGATMDDLAPILTEGRLPALRRLGLQNTDLQDEIAAALASAPVVAQLEELDLTMGALTERGVEALLAGQPLSHLKRLDLHDTYLSGSMAERLKAALPGVDLDLGDTAGAPWLLGRRRTPAEFYIAVTE